MSQWQAARLFTQSRKLRGRAVSASPPVRDRGSICGCAPTRYPRSRCRSIGVLAGNSFGVITLVTIYSVAVEIERALGAAELDLDAAVLAAGAAVALGCEKVTSVPPG